jgi:hypothetical protein
MTKELLDDSLYKQEFIQSVKYRVFIIWSFFLIVGVIFRFLHFPGSAVLIVTSTAGITSYAINGIILSKGKDKLSILFTILGVSWIFFLIIGIIFLGGHPYNSQGLTIHLTLFFVYFFIYFFVLRIRFWYKTKKSIQ